MAARSISSCSIMFGVVAIPVKIYVACSADSLKFNLISPSGHRVRQRYTDAETGEEVSMDKCFKGYEYAKDQFVLFTPEEIQAFEAERSNDMQIQEFIPLASVDMVQVERTYYLAPGKGGQKGYVLLANVMAGAGRAAVAKWSSRGKEHLVILRAYKGGIIVHQMFYHTEVRDFGEVLDGSTDHVLVSDAELKLAKKLVRFLSTRSFTPNKYTDTYAVGLREAVDAKVAGKAVVFTAPDAESKATVVDLLDALKASLETD